MTRLSCHRLRGNEVRLWLSILCDSTRERYNSEKSVPKKEIPAQWQQVHQFEEVEKFIRNIRAANNLPNP
jgi:hypothetical protein